MLLTYLPSPATSEWALVHHPYHMSVPPYCHKLGSLGLLYWSRNNCNKARNSEVITTYNFLLLLPLFYVFSQQNSRTEDILTSLQGTILWQLCLPFLSLSVNHHLSFHSFNND